MDPTRGHGLKAYRQNQLAALSPGELLITALDVGIQACEVGNTVRARAAVEELIGGLDFTYDLSKQFFVHYDWILRLITEGRFSDAQRHLMELREAWSAVVRAEPKAGDESDEAEAKAA